MQIKGRIGCQKLHRGLVVKYQVLRTSLRKRLKSSLKKEEIIGESKTEFMKMRRTRDSISKLNTLIKNKIKEKEGRVIHIF